MQKQAATPKATSYQSIAHADAVSIVENNTAGFDSAAKLAAQRPRVKHEISGFTVESLAPDSEGSRSEVRFSPLPLGLDYMLHHVPASETKTALTESSIDVFGATGVLYWNSRFSYRNGAVNVAPEQVRLVSGQLFEPGAKFVLENGTGKSAVTLDCAPISRAAATTIHASLSGNVTTFACKQEEGVSQLLWYFDDYARYFNEEVKVDDEIQSRFKIISVYFTGPRTSLQ